MQKFFLDIARTFNVVISMADVKGVITNVDLNKDGKLSFEEIKPVIL